MTGLYNTIGHETESETGEVAGRLFDHLADIYRMLASVERHDTITAEQLRSSVIPRLETVALQFENLAVRANDRPLFIDLPDGRQAAGTQPAGASPDEVARLIDELRANGIPLPMRNGDLFRIPARQVRTLIVTVMSVQFVGRHVDWYTIRDVVESVNRLTALGVTVSRVASLHGTDPRLEY